MNNVVGSQLILVKGLHSSSCLAHADSPSLSPGYPKPIPGMRPIISHRHTPGRPPLSQSTVTFTYVKIAGPNWLINTSGYKIACTANRDKWMEEMGIGQNWRVSIVDCRFWILDYRSLGDPMCLPLTRSPHRPLTRSFRTPTIPTSLPVTHFTIKISTVIIRPFSTGLSLGSPVS
jgi:hypothetical protein